MWLKGLFDAVGKPVHDFECNEHTIKVLYELMERNLQGDRFTEVIIEDYRQKTIEYKAEGDIVVIEIAKFL